MTRKKICSFWFVRLRPLFVVWCRLKLQWNSHLDLETVGVHWSPLYKILYVEDVFIKNLHFFSTEERQTWTSWVTWINDWFLFSHLLSCFLKEAKVGLSLISFGILFQCVQPLIERTFCANEDFLNGEWRFSSLKI